MSNATKEVAYYCIADSVTMALLTRRYSKETSRLDTRKLGN